MFSFKQRLEEAIDHGRRSITESLQSIEEEYSARKDYIVKNEKIDISKCDAGYQVTVPSNDVEQYQSYLLTPHSEAQMFIHYGIPRTYAEKLDSWNMRELIEHNFKEINEKHLGGQSIMLRTIGNTAKGWLSPSYKRLDAAPVIGTFVEECQDIDMVPIRGFNTDSRYQFRYAFPEVITPKGLDNESTIIGASLTTSDYGGSAFRLELFLMRLICLNGMIGQMLFRKVHLGSRFESMNDIHLLSEATHTLDMKTIQSGIKDLVKALPPKREFIKGMIEESFEKTPSKAAWDLIKKATDKDTYGEIEAMYKNNTDIELLPQQESMWKLSNAIALIAQSKKDDYRIDLENLAMKQIA